MTRGETTPSLREAWDSEAERWVEWVRRPGHDSYDQFHRRQLLGLLPPPGNLTIDVGCGEGRVTRDLQTIGHTVIGIEPSRHLISAANESDQTMPLIQADGARLPVPDEAADLVVAFMVVQDMDDPQRFFAEATRVLEPSGRLHVTITHPINSAGAFDPPAGAYEATDGTRRYVFHDSYFETRRLEEPAERDGLSMTFTSEHRPLQAYSGWLEDAGFVIERIRETQSTVPDSGWQRVPLFAHLAAVKLPVVANRDRRLFHITNAEAVMTLQTDGELRPASLESEGFVHFSTAAQVVPSTERHFPPDAELVLLELDPEALAADVRWPEVYPGERFPHLHGPINGAALVRVHPWGASDRAAWTAN